MGSDNDKRSNPALALKYGLDDIPKPLPLFLYGMQWLVVSVPSVIIMGVVIARIHSPDTAFHIGYNQRLFAVIGATLVVQALLGHRLPLVCGPASILAVGITASSGSSIPAQYTAIAVGGALLALAGATGLLSRLRVIFTPRIVAVVLLLIAFTLAPTILRLIIAERPESWQNVFQIVFAVILVFGLILTNDRLPGIAKSMTLLIGMVGGTLVYFLALGFPQLAAVDSPAKTFPGLSLEFHAGAILSFLFCFMGLAINELGSVEALGRLLRVEDLDQRVRRGLTVSGASNFVSGLFGVIGTVDFSMSAGMIAATGCASRYTFILTGLGFIACASSQSAILVLATIPGPVMGVLMLYLMSVQLASGLAMLGGEKGGFDFGSGLIVGLPIMIGMLVAFCPPATFAVFPALVRPILGNGFVMGTLAVLIMEHVIFRRPKGN